MLKEIFQYLSTPYASEFRQLGYLKELIAIDSKYPRVKSIWHSHLQSSQKAIGQAVESVSQHRRVIILGAGLLLDVPLKELCEHFNEVVLMDVAFLNKTRQQVKAFNNIKLIEFDVTGLARRVLEYKKGEALLESRPVIPELNDKTDLVISLNLFSQLPICLKRWFSRKFQISDAVLDDWGLRIMRQHLNYLNQLSASVLVIGDRQHRYLRHGQVVMENNFANALALPLPDIEWPWLVSPKGELPDGVSLQSQVGVWFDWQRKYFDT